MSDERNTKKALLAIMVVSLLTLAVSAGLFLLLMQIPFPFSSFSGSASGILFPTSDIPEPETQPVIRLGHYEQDGNIENGPEIIDWIILSEENGQYLLLSRDVLNVLPYHNISKTDITWENCSLRKWLNENFFFAAFSPDEQSRILLSQTDNTNTLDIWSSEGGNDTEDHVFLLSAAEVKQYFDTDEDRKCNASKACAENAFETDACTWWLRSPGFSQQDAERIYVTGSIHTVRVTSDLIGVRPAIRISIPQSD
ncbi:MAG: hypothetical protein IJ242_09290 [Clostridia bacterium]|nr:hypothetical protein [Clostridia bacterium]